MCSRSILNYDMGAYGRPSSRQTPIDHLACMVCWMIGMIGADVLEHQRPAQHGLGLSASESLCDAQAIYGSLL